LPIATDEQTRAIGLPGGPLSHEIAPLLRQHDMTRLAALGLAHLHCPGIWVEVVNRHRGQFTIAAAGQQRARDQGLEIGRAGIRQLAGFVIRRIAQPGRVGLAALRLAQERAPCAKRIAEVIWCSPHQRSSPLFLCRETEFVPAACRQHVIGLSSNSRSICISTVCRERRDCTHYDQIARYRPGGHLPTLPT
jgi:hypothetical protein